MLAEHGRSISVLEWSFGEKAEELRQEVWERGLLLETAARFALRAEAERTLRSQLVSPRFRQPGVSVLIACWNHAGAIRQAVESALAAIDLLPCPGEVLILDDASPRRQPPGGRGVRQRGSTRSAHCQRREPGAAPPRNVLLSQAAL